MSSEAEDLLREAEKLFREKQIEDAAQFYKEAGLLFRQDRESMRAAKAFSQSSLCEKLRTGFQPLLEAANLSEMAAREALKAKDYAYARWQFRDAGLLYEREGDFEKYSYCFVLSQDAFLEYLWTIFITGKKQERLKPGPLPASPAERLKALVQAVLGVVSRYLWGYGEKPGRLLLAGTGLVAVCGLLYYFSGQVAFHGKLYSIDIFDAFYMSGVTFSTLGYGDFTPLGWTRLVSFVESLSGFFLVPLFMISLTRRYLRVYR